MTLEGNVLIFVLADSSGYGEKNDVCHLQGRELMSNVKIVVSVAVATMLTGCMGALGGGDNRYVPRTAQGITKLTITKQQSPAFNGGSFGAIGQYELISGIAEGELDPKDPRNAIITDLDLAPRLPNGNVRYATTFSIAKPLDMRKANGLLYHANANRGTGSLSGNKFPNANAFGDVEVVVGWQAEIDKSAEHRVTEAPVPKNRDGSEVTGIVLARMADFAAGTTTQTLQVLGREIPYDSTMDKSKGRLIKKISETRYSVWPSLPLIRSTRIATSASLTFTLLRKISLIYLFHASCALIWRVRVVAGTPLFSMPARNCSGV